MVYSSAAVKFTCKSALELSSNEKARLKLLFQSNNFLLDQGDFGPLDYVALAQNGHAMLGFRRFKKHVFSSLSGESHNCFQCCDTITDVAARGQRISTRLIEAFKAEVKDCSFLFNFPNNMSLPVYRKMGFKIIDYNLTILKWGQASNYIAEDVLTDDQLNDTKHLYQYRLRQGLLSKVPFYGFGKIGQPKPLNHQKLHLMNLSMMHMWEQHGLATLRSAICLVRPVTFMPIRDINPEKINITATSFDSLK